MEAAIAPRASPRRRPKSEATETSRPVTVAPAAVAAAAGRFALFSSARIWAGEKAVSGSWTTLRPASLTAPAHADEGFGRAGRPRCANEAGKTGCRGSRFAKEASTFSSLPVPILGWAAGTATSTATAAEGRLSSWHMHEAIVAHDITRPATAGVICGWAGQLGSRLDLAFLCRAGYRLGKRGRVLYLCQPGYLPPTTLETCTNPQIAMLLYRIGAAHPHMQTGLRQSDRTTGDWLAGWHTCNTATLHSPHGGHTYHVRSWRPCYRWLATPNHFEVGMYLGMMVSSLAGLPHLPQRPASQRRRVLRRAGLQISRGGGVARIAAECW